MTYEEAANCAVEGKLWDETQRWLMLFANRVTASEVVFQQPLTKQAHALWQAGKRDAVIEYFKLCAAKDWRDQRGKSNAKRWLKEVREGRWPIDAPTR